MKSFHRRSSRPATEPIVHTVSPVERHGLLRADSLLVDQGLAPSRTAARVLIEAGRVSWAGGPITKPAQTLAASVPLSVSADDEADRFVSRGGFKLAGALRASAISVSGRVALDVGQSTGGFTDCLLQAGASRVIGVEVGHGQIHPRLAADPRCVSLEGINARYLVAADLGEHFPPAGFDLIVCDASFISLTLLLPQWSALLAKDGDVPGGDILALVKPQFEVGAKGLSKGGIVRDAALYAVVEARLRDSAAACRLKVQGWFDSPITGTDGNREFFIWMQHEHD
ncbi:MAG: TlyA family RNA methyltransferase [Azoarcus sp.]|nr:TlyA family RNA methyltransferase [Azoarcus sp.]